MGCRRAAFASSGVDASSRRRLLIPVVSPYGGNALRTLQRKPKDRRKVPIPAELRDSLHEVFELIQQAKSDPDIRLDYDDAIQVGAVCGGRIGTKPRPYVLTYYPEGDGERGRWFLTWGGPNSWRRNCRWGLRFAEPLPRRLGSPARL